MCKLVIRYHIIVSVKFIASLTIIKEEKNINNNNLFLIFCVLNSSHCFFFWWKAIIIKKDFESFHIIPKETDNLLSSLMVFVHSGYGGYELKLKIGNIYLSISLMWSGPLLARLFSLHFIVNGFFDTLWIMWDKLRMRCKW